MNGLISEKFEEIANNVDQIFTSFTELQDLYVSALTQIGKIESINLAKKQEIDRWKLAVKNCESTVFTKQQTINTLMYAQGLVLLIGSSESLIREVFYALVQGNPLGIRVKDTITFNYDDLCKSLMPDIGPGSVLLEKLNDERNPSGKLNFQNVEHLKNLFKDYFDIVFENDDCLDKMHLYWQIRHIVIHRASVIDSRFIKNLKKANISTNKYTEGERIIISQTDYKKCRIALKSFFNELDNAIVEKKFILSSSF